MDLLVTKKADIAAIRSVLRGRGKSSSDELPEEFAVTLFTDELLAERRKVQVTLRADSTTGVWTFRLLSPRDVAADFVYVRRGSGGRDGYRLVVDTTKRRGRRAVSRLFVLAESVFALERPDVVEHSELVNSAA